MVLAEGAVFAGYRIARILGAGGMGEVYLAEHPRLPRRDALKILRAEISRDEDYRRRFIREADLAAGLWHPNIVRVNDRGESDGQLWISMDYVGGTDAATLLSEHHPNGLPAADVAPIVTAVATALDYAHQRGLLHRDVKPANILLGDSPGDDGRILLGDFGIARAVNEVSGLTATNMAIGTLAYAAPEQLMGEPIDGRADQYALAATAYQLLCGTPVFPDSNPAVVIGRHLTSPPPAIAALRPDLADVDPVLARALAKDPGDRFASCSDFARALCAVVTSLGLSGAADTVLAPVARQPIGAVASVVRRRRPSGRVTRWAIPIAVLLLIAAGTGIVAQRHRWPGSVAPAPAAVLDGTYRLSYHHEQQTLNGAPAPPDPASAPPTPDAGPPANPSIPDSPDAAPAADDVTWWALRSTCTSAGCTAAGTKLDTADRAAAANSGTTVELRFVDGRWLSGLMNSRQRYPECGIENGKHVPGDDTEADSWWWRPQPDGELRGVWTNTVLTDECSLQGSVKQVPVTVTRTGDVPAGVAIADPAAISTQPPKPSVTDVPAPGGPVLDGAYRLDFDNANRKVNGVITPLAEPSGPDWWAFRSLCGSMGCVATGILLDDDNHQLPTAVTKVLHFVNGRWEQVPSDTLMPMCTITRNGQTGPQQYVTFRQSRTWSPQPDGSLRGTNVISIVGNDCANEGTVYEYPFVATRVSDIPGGVVLADPELFIS